MLALVRSVARTVMGVFYVYVTVCQVLFRRLFPPISGNRNNFPLIPLADFLWEGFLRLKSHTGVLA
jgi:hypothetical protein